MPEPNTPPTADVPSEVTWLRSVCQDGAFDARTILVSLQASVVAHPELADPIARLERLADTLEINSRPSQVVESE